jgi:pyruvate/2-oxoglutarate dehydrogenase complex dihydrolipoamide acyltransferase (E2) component
MILVLNMPRVGEAMRAGTVHRIIAKPGEALRPGTALLEVRVDLSQSKAQDCPPLFFFRLIAAERGWLRTLRVHVGEVLSVAAPLGVATTTIEEAADGPAARMLRTTSVSIQIDPLSV